MRKVKSMLLSLFFVVLSLTNNAEAQNAKGIGVGVEKTLGGIAGASLVIDMGQFRVDVLFHFDYRNRRECCDYMLFGFAGRFFFVLHSMRQADFSLGGGFGVIAASNDPAPYYDYVALQLECAMQIRAFVVPSFAIHGSLGLAISFGEDINTGVQLGEGWGGGLLGSFGATYFF